jgi:hypothetical protein
MDTGAMSRMWPMSHTGVVVTGSALKACEFTHLT